MADPKMVPEWTLLKEKKRAEKAEEKLQQEREKSIRLQVEKNTAEGKVKTLQLNLQDEGELKEIRDYLIMESDTLEKGKSELEADKASVNQTLREARASELVVLLKEKGVEVDKDTLLDEDDLDKAVNNILMEHLAKGSEKSEDKDKGKEEKSEEKEPGSEAFESAQDTVPVKKDVWAKSDEEFNKDWEADRQKALAKR